MRYKVNTTHIFGKGSHTFRSKKSAIKYAKLCRKGIGFFKVRMRKIK